MKSLHYRMMSRPAWRKLAMGLIGTICFFQCSLLRCETLLLYGALNRTDGFNFIKLSEGVPEQVATANELRPPSVVANWSRMFVPLVPLSVENEYAYYYVSVDSSAAKVTGVFRKKLHDKAAAELLFQTPKLNSLCKQAHGGKVLAVADTGELLLLDISERTMRSLGSRRVSCASWLDEQRLVAIEEGTGSLFVMDSANSQVEALGKIAIPEVKQLFDLGSKRYLLRVGWKVFVHDLGTEQTTELSFLDGAAVGAILLKGHVVYGLVPGEDDSRTLVCLDLESHSSKEIVRGVLADSVMQN